MSEAAETRRSSPWPFVAISILILLMAAFLYVRLSKRQKVSDRPDPQPVAQKDKGEAKNDTGAPETTRRPDRDALLEKARTCLDEGRLDDAAAAIEEARKLGPGQDVEKLQSDLQQARQDAKVREQQRQAAIALGELKQNWDNTWKPKYLWDQAMKAVDEFSAKYPASKDDVDFGSLRKDVQTNRDQHHEAYTMNLGEARKLHAGGQTARALQKLQIASQYYPERMKEIDAIRSEWEAKLLDKEMVRITDVEVWIGNDEIESEKPRRKYRGKPFKIDRYEVTNEEYAAFLSANPDYPAHFAWKGRKHPPEMARLPVSFIKLADAEAYAKWAKKRLPTEEEWEKAARFIDGRRYPWGEEFPTPGSGEFMANSWEFWQHFADRGKPPAPTLVGHFPNGKSGFDVYDMAGNVWEWTSTRVVVEQNGEKVEMGVLKGGSFMTTKDALRCSNRLLDEVDFGHPDYGFRCVRD